MPASKMMKVYKFTAESAKSPTGQPVYKVSVNGHNDSMGPLREVIATRPRSGDLGFLLVRLIKPCASITTETDAEHRTCSLSIRIYTRENARNATLLWTNEVNCRSFVLTHEQSSQMAELRKSGMHCTQVANDQVKRLSFEDLASFDPSRVHFLSRPSLPQSDQPSISNSKTRS